MANKRFLLWCVVAACAVAACLVAYHRATRPPLTRGPYVSKVTKDSAELFFEVQPASEVVIQWSAGGIKNEKVLPAGTSHEETLSALAPGSRYHYEIQARNQGQGKIVRFGAGSFTTAPDQPCHFKFALYGDTRRGHAIHKQIADAIAKEEVDFALHTGDFVADGRKQEKWAPEFFVPAAELLRTAAVFPVLGNHEHKSPLYYQYFGLPADKAWYSFSWGQVEVFVVDTESDYSRDGEQWKWLDAALAASKAAWKIAVQHVPGISSSGHGSNKQVNKNLRPLYEKYGVDIAFAGHNHLYERTKPIASKGANHPVTYIITGGGGSLLYKASQAPYDAVIRSCHHYVIVEAEVGSLRVTARQVDGQILDSFVLKKNDPDYLGTRMEFEDLKLQDVDHND